MGVEIFIEGLREAGPQLDSMLDLKRKCDELKMDYPPQLVEYFEGTDALEMRNEYARNEALSVDIRVEGDVMYDDGAYIDLSELPEDVKKIRIYCS